MPINMRNYSSEPLFSADYLKVRKFLHKINRNHLIYPGFPWGRWEWMITHSSLDRGSLHRIGIWEDNDEIVGLATYESDLGYAYLFTASGYERLVDEMLLYSKSNLSKDGVVRVIIDNNDRACQRAAENLGFTATQEQENTAIIDINDRLTYTLPKGFSIISMAEEWDLANQRF